MLKSLAEKRFGYIDAMGVTVATVFLTQGRAWECIAAMMIGCVLSSVVDYYAGQG